MRLSPPPDWRVWLGPWDAAMRAGWDPAARVADELDVRIVDAVTGGVGDRTAVAVAMASYSFSTKWEAVSRRDQERGRRRAWLKCFQEMTKR